MSFKMLLVMLLLQVKMNKRRMLTKVSTRVFTQEMHEVREEKRCFNVHTTLPKKRKMKLAMFLQQMEVKKY